MKWISIDEQQPRAGQRVLVFMPTHEDYDICWYHTDGSFSGRTRRLERKSISHWAELLPPETDG